MDSYSELGILNFSPSLKLLKPRTQRRCLREICVYAHTGHLLQPNLPARQILHNLEMMLTPDVLTYLSYNKITLRSYHNAYLALTSRSCHSDNAYLLICLQLRLIPGFRVEMLPDEIAFECLVRVPRMYHTQLRGVCRRWRSVVGSPQFLARRKELGLSSESLFLFPMEMDIQPGNGIECVEIDLHTRTAFRTIFTEEKCVDTNDISYMFNFYRFDSQETGRYDMRVFGCRCASLGHLVIIFGNLQTHNSRMAVVLNTVTKTWRKGAAVVLAEQGYTSTRHCVVDGKLYLISHFPSKVKWEVYDPATDSWADSPPLPGNNDFSSFDTFYSLGRRLIVQSGSQQHSFWFRTEQNAWVEKMSESWRYRHLDYGATCACTW